MQWEVVQPNPVTFVGVLNACASVVALQEGRRVHQQILENGYESNVFVGNRLINMYAKCWNVEDACRVFNEMPLRNVVSWTSLILGHVNYGQGRKARELFQLMQWEGLKPDVVAWNAMILEQVKCGQGHKVLELFKLMQSGGMEPDVVTFVGSTMHVLVYWPLKRAGVFMRRSFEVVASLMPLWVIVLFTCMPSVGAWWILGECLTRWPKGMWSHGLL